MRSFDYLRPSSLEEAVQILDHHQEQAKVMAGGTTLLLMLKQRLFAPEILVDIKGVPGLDVVAMNGELRIGGAVTHRGVERSADVRSSYPVLAKTAAQVANTQVRNKGTLAGNLCQAEPASDPGTVLLAYDASVQLTGLGGNRLVPLSDFFQSYYETAIQPNEILTEVRVPAPAPDTIGLYYKFTPRSYADKPTAGVAVLLDIDESSASIRDARIALGNCGPTPLRCREAEERLRGNVISDTLAAEVGSIASGEADPRDDVRSSADYRRQIIKVLVRRALLELTGKEG